METHKHIRIVGLIYMVLGCIGLAFFPFAAYVGINDFLRILASETKNELQGKVLIYIWLGLFAILIFSLGFIMVGKAIRAEKKWATRIVGFIFAILILPSFPIGTAIGIYAIWALNKVIKDEPATTKSISLTE